MKILAMPGGGHARSYIYQNGTFNVSVDNPGTYTQGAGGITMIGASLQATKIVIAGVASPLQCACVGTTNQLDLTNFNTLKVRCKVTNSNLRIYLSSSKTSYNNNSYINHEVTDTTDHWETIDISLVSNAYLLLSTLSSSSGEVYEIYVE